MIPEHVLFNVVTRVQDIWRCVHGPSPYDISITCQHVFVTLFNVQTAFLSFQSNKNNNFKKSTLMSSEQHVIKMLILLFSFLWVQLFIESTKKWHILYLNLCSFECNNHSNIKYDTLQQKETKSNLLQELFENWSSMTRVRQPGILFHRGFY